MGDGRVEHRMGASMAGRLETLEQSISERVLIQNVSGRGARVITERTWQPHAHVSLVDIVGGSRIGAEVIYCQRLSSNLCAVGLKFVDESSWGTLLRS